jgi:glycosyltransferase involved in cell wall biosynthesis
VGAEEGQVNVTVLVPVFNGEQFIGRCIRSLLSQSTRSSYEILVIDDGSTDRTARELSQFANSIRVLRSEENQGLPSALNMGLSKSFSHYLVRVDADDFVNEFFIEFLVQYLQSNPTHDAVACDYLLVDDEELVLSHESATLNPIGCGILFKTSDVKELGGYNPIFKRQEDREFRQRFEKTRSVGHLPIHLYRYRRHGSNITNDKRLMSYFDNLLESGESYQ